MPASSVASTEQKTNASVPAGQAVKTSPPAGSEVDAGSSVVLTVSRGPKQVTVPDITGQSAADAGVALEAAGLAIGEGTRVEDDAPRDTVLDQDPPAGTSVAAGSAVDVTLSSGASSVTVPDVKGLAEADAVAALADAGLVGGQHRAEDQRQRARRPGRQDQPARGQRGRCRQLRRAHRQPGSQAGHRPRHHGPVRGRRRGRPRGGGGHRRGRPVRGQRRRAAAGGVDRSRIPAPAPSVDAAARVAYVVSLRSHRPSRMRRGGSLESPAVISQLDAVAAAIPAVRELELAQVPYDALSAKDQKSQLASRSEDLHDPATLDAEEAALKRMGLLEQGDDLAKLLRQLYGQPLPVAYGVGSMDVLQSLDALDGAARGRRRARVRPLGDRPGLRPRCRPWRRPDRRRRSPRGGRARRGRRHGRHARLVRREPPSDRGRGG